MTTKIAELFPTASIFTVALTADSAGQSSRVANRFMVVAVTDTNSQVPFVIPALKVRGKRSALPLQYMDCLEVEQDKSEPLDLMVSLNLEPDFSIADSKP